MSELGRALVVQGDAAHLPLPGNSVDLICTSPPYFALRSYQDGGKHYAGQVGSEATPQEFLEALWACTAEWVRVLKPSGSIFVNLGDKYQGSGGSSGHTGQEVGQGQRVGYRNARTGPTPVKSLMLLPERYRIGAVDRLGLIARAVIIWSKPNGLPESVTDRVRRSHEDWVHLTKAPRYYTAVDDIREEHTFPLQSRTMGRSANGGLHSGEQHKRQDGGANPLGKLPGSVWTVPTEPLTLPPELGVDHFAAYPTEWPRRIIQGWSPRHVCCACGEGRRPDVHREYQQISPHGDHRRGYLKGNSAEWTQAGGRAANQEFRLGRASQQTTITGWVCACTPHTDHPGTGTDGPRNRGTGWAAATGDRDNPGGGYGNAPRTGPWREYHHDQWDPAPTRPGIVLDPFGGTGTTALVARALGRDAITIDLSHDYGRASRWRTTDPGQLAKACGVDKPPVQVVGQEELWPA